MKNYRNAITGISLGLFISFLVFVVGMTFSNLPFQKRDDFGIYVTIYKGGKSGTQVCKGSDCKQMTWEEVYTYVPSDWVEEVKEYHRTH